MQALDRSETDIRVEGMSALARLADDRSVDAVRAKILPFTTLTDQSLAGAAQRALTELDTRFGGRRPSLAAPGTLTQAAAAARADQQRTLLIESADVSAIMKKAEALQRLDIATLKPGDMHRGPLQVHRAHRPRRIRHRAADGGHRRRRAAGAQVPEPEHRPGRGDDAAVRARAALQPQDHAPERDPHLRLPAHPRQLRDLDGVLSLAHARRRGVGRQAARAAPRRAPRHGRRQGHVGRARRSASCTATSSPRTC